jgi:hypothetical protein
MPDSSPSLLSEKLASDSNSTLVHIAPDIPFHNEDAFYPLRLDKSDNKIKPSYQFRECKSRFIICTKWVLKTVYFEDLTWFYHAGFGLSKLAPLGE